MARVKLSSFLKSVSGLMDDVVYVNKYGREYCRIYVKPSNPNTEGQRMLRRTFGDAVRAWQALSNEDKGRWNRQARRLPLSGYNLFISRYMKENISHNRTLAAGRGAYGGSSSLLRNIHSSVYAPYPGRTGAALPQLRAPESPGMG